MLGITLAAARGGSEDLLDLVEDGLRGERKLTLKSSSGSPSEMGIDPIELLDAVADPRQLVDRRRCAERWSVRCYS